MIGVLSYNGYTMAATALGDANHHQPHPQTLHNGSWTSEVRDVCVAIGFDLRTHDKDPLFPGSFHACHAEKQLITYSIDWHFSWETELPNSDVVMLERLRPLGLPPKACIVVNSRFCPDCDAFIRFVRENFALEVEVLSR
jgi:hypothetical protein